MDFYGGADYNKPVESPESVDRKWIAALILGGVLLYAGSLNDPFHFDDQLILQDSNVTNPERGLHFFNPLFLRQLTFFSFYLNYLLAGPDPAMYHLTNVLLHVLNAVLVLVLAWRVDAWLAKAAALVFLVHPIQTEVVLYVYQRSLLLAAGFGLLGVLAYREGRKYLAILCFVLAFEGKESAVAIPLTLAVILTVLGGAGSRLRAGLLGIALLLTAAGLGLLVYQQEQTVGVGAIDEVSPAAYAMTQALVIPKYLKLLVWPAGQSIEHDVPFERSISPMVVVALLAIAATLLTGLALAANHRTRVGGLAIVAFLLLLAPTSSVVPSRDAMFEHRLYLPMLAFSIGVAWVLSRVPGRTVLLAVLTIALTGATVARSRVWSTQEALWEDAVRKAPARARAWFNLGGATLKSNPARSREAFTRTLQLQPGFAEAWYNLGILDQDAGNLDGAMSHYERAVAIQPKYWPAWSNMGNVAYARGRHDRAIEYFETVLRLNPDYWPAQHNIAMAHMADGAYSRAIPRLRTVLDWKPDFDEARLLLADALDKAGYRNQAEAERAKVRADGRGK